MVLMNNLFVTIHLLKYGQYYTYLLQKRRKDTTKIALNTNAIIQCAHI